MPDISMCANGKTCPVKDRCYRFTAEPNPYRQSYMNFDPGKGEKCPDFWPVKSKSEMRRFDVQTKKLDKKK